MIRALKRHRVTIGLVVTAAVLGGLAYWDRDRVTTDEAGGRKLQLFEAWRPDDIASLVVEGPGGRVEVSQATDPNGEHTFTLKEGEKNLSADEQEVEDFFLTLEYAGFERRVEGLDRKTLGLDAPHLVVTVTMGQLHYVLRVGAEAPSPKGARYAEVEGGTRPKATYVLKSELVKALDDEPRSLRSKQLSPYVSSDVARYELAGATAWKLERAGSGGRATVDLTVDSVETGRQRAGFRTVDAWTTALTRLEAQNFVDDSGASKPIASLTIVPRDPKKPKAVLEFLGPCDGGTLVRRTEPDVFAACVDAHVAETVRVPPSRFVDDFVLGLPETDVTEVKWQSGETVVDIARRGEGWHLRKPDDSQIDAAVGNAIVERLARAEGVRESAADASDLKKLGLADPRATVRVVGLPDRAAGPDAPEHIEELEVGDSQDGIVFVRRKLDGVVLKVSAEVASALLPAPSALRSTQLQDLPQKHVRALALDCDGKRQAMSRDSKGVWTRTEPKDTDLRADMSAANELTEALRTLSAIRWDAEKPEPRHGLEKPWCTLRLVVAEPDANGNTAPDDPKEKRRSIEIALGAETEGGYFARRDAAGAVFVAPRPIAAMSREWLLDRAALLMEPNDVDHVTVTVKDRQLDLRRRGDAWTLARGAKANDTRASAVGKALEALLAEGVSTLGKPATSEGFDEPRARIAITKRDGAGVVELTVGRTSVWQDTKVAFVRRTGLDATFVVSLARLAPVLDAP